MKRTLLLFFAVISLNLSGQEPVFRWVRNIPFSVVNQCIDSDDNIYVAGEYRGSFVFENDSVVSQGESDVIVAKFNNTGALLWYRLFGGDDDDYTIDIKPDHNNDVVLLTLFNHSTVYYGDTFSAPGHGALLTKLTSDGDLLWFKMPGYNDNNCIHVYSAAVDQNNNILIAGNIQNGNGIFPDTIIPANGKIVWFIAKYKPNGTFEWVRTLNDIYLEHCIFDFSNNLLIFGDTSMKFSETYTLVWKKKSSVPWDGKLKVAVDNLNNAYLTSIMGKKYFIGQDTIELSDSGRFLFVKINPAGVPVLSGSAITKDFFMPNAISVFDDKIGITGTFREKVIFDNDSLISMSDILTNSFLVVYDLAGNLQYAKMIGSKKEVGLQLISIGKSMYLSGYAYDTAYFDSIVFIRNHPYSWFLARLQYKFEKPDINPESDNISLYPNPTYGYLTIEYKREYRNVTIDIFSLQGRHVRRYIPENYSTMINIEDLSHGLYFIRLITDEGIFMEKFLKI